MKIEIAPHERMSETGSSLIRLIQNNDMPFLDLLVREAVQNSLDAARPGEGFVQVDFSIRDFPTHEFASHLDGVADRLAELFPKESYRLLEIRDRNTQGLTGPLHEQGHDSRAYGNLIKLIYQIGMPQQREGSGGSWGIGKTVYFRIGVGLVLYYSRICEEGVYSSRLAACLVEDQEKPDAILIGKGHQRGIAWWGQPVTDGTKTMPITDEEEIGAILASLGAVPFGGSETGTAIIIPFMRDDLRPTITMVAEEDENAVGNQEVLPWWQHNDSDYIKVALQRWYAPRLMNPDYPGGRWLRATVDGEGMTREQFLPAFKWVQELYKAATMRNGAHEGVECIPVKLRKTFVSDTVAGWIAFTKLTSRDLGMGAPHNHPSPWVQVLGMDISDEQNPALISYTRKPGMLVGYEYTGKWVEGMPKTSMDEYIMGIFVVNSGNVLQEEHPKHPERDFLLEEYIRGCEKADHTSWSDWTPSSNNPMIVGKIQKQVVKVISNQYVEKQDKPPVKRDKVLGKMLADVFLPPEGFGNFGGVPKPPKPSSGGGSTSTGKHARFISFSSPQFEGELVRIDFELFSGTGKKTKSIDVTLRISTESGEVDADNWEDDNGIGTQFPLELIKVTILGIGNPKTGVVTLDSPVVLDAAKEASEHDNVTIKMVESRKYHRRSGIDIQCPASHIIQGSFWLASKYKTVRASFHIESLEEAKV